MYLLTFLWFVGHQTSSYRDVADCFGLSLSTLFNVLSRVTEYLLLIAPSIIQLPDNEGKKRIEEHFHTKHGFPGIIGNC